MEVGEKIAVKELETEIKNKCPFKESDEGVDKEEDEGIEDDDGDEVQKEQDNNGGTLGGNLESGRAGANGTVGGPYEPTDYLIKSPQKKPRVLVPESDDVEADDYPVTVAAHHLVPGNAALGQSTLYDFLGPCGSGVLKDDGAVRKRKNISTGGKTYEIKKLIGYNVNGAHNGVWLPGNYAIRKYQPKKKKRAAIPNTSPVGGAKGGQNWGDLSEKFDDWKFNYVAAATKVAGGQFHDTHEYYSERVLKLLSKMAIVLQSHLNGGKCDCCAKEKLPPPFTVKKRLYELSKFLRVQVTGGVSKWKDPWFTSDHWSEIIFKSKKTHKAFLVARNAAKKVD